MKYLNDQSKDGNENVFNDLDLDIEEDVFKQGNDQLPIDSNMENEKQDDQNQIE